MYDIVIQNGTLIDGTGSPGLRADLAVKDGKIVRIARKIVSGARFIDAAGLVVTPGFIDSHSHSDKEFFTCPGQTEKVEQGITTSVAGQCGGSVCAADAGEFLDNARNAALGANMAMLMGHGSLRRAVMGNEDRAPTSEELEKMKALLREAMEHGALGVSFGLIYAPGCFAETHELVEMARVVAEYQGIAAIHLRSENTELIKAVNEFIAVLRASGVRGVLSHHKATQRENWGKVSHTLRMLDQTNEEGLELYADVYPYAAASSRFSAAFIPVNWRGGGTDALLERVNDPALYAQCRGNYIARHGNDMSWIMLTDCPGHPEYEGMLVSDIAKLRGQDDFDAAMDIVRDSRDACKCCFFSMCEEDVETVIAHPRVMICTDAGVAGSAGTYHPRLRGSFPRALGRYVRERGVVSLPEMIRKMTSMPAAVYGFKTKGLLVEGFDADICIFDPDRIADRCSFADCHLRAEGLRYVLVAGRIAAEDAVATGELAGKLLYRDL